MSTAGGALGGRGAIVTGAGSGIGRASAVRLAEAGAAVMASDIDAAAAAETAAMLPSSAVACEADVADRASVERMVALAVEAFGGVDILHCNAAVPQATAGIDELPIEDWERNLRVNMSGAFHCIQAVVPAMRERGGGSIVITSSVSAVRPRRGTAAYVASKSGLNGLARVAALDLAADHIRVNTVLPGPVASPFLRAMKLADDDPEGLEQIAAGIPLGELITPESIASAVAFLAGDEARQITGAVLNVDGGRGL